MEKALILLPWILSGRRKNDIQTSSSLQLLQPPSISDGIIPRAVYDLFDERKDFRIYVS